MEARAWRRGFLAGIAALVLSVGGQLAVSRASAGEQQCPLAAQQPGLAEQVIAHLKPSLGMHVAQRVALAVLGAMLHSACS